MKNISILGPSGAGKTTLSRSLSEQHGMPVLHYDTINARPDTRRVLEGFIRDNNPRIIESFLCPDLDMIISSADIIILLEPGRVTCAKRYFIRSIKASFGSLDDSNPQRPGPLSISTIRAILGTLIGRYDMKVRPRIIQQLAEFGEGREIVCTSGTGFTTISTPCPYLLKPTHDR